MTHTIQNLRVGMVDMNSHIPAPLAAKKIMNDAVNNAQLQIAEGNRGNVMSIGNYDLQLSGEILVDDKMCVDYLKLCQFKLKLTGYK